MNLKRLFGVICVTCVGASTQLLAQLPEVESLSKVPAWVSADNPNDNMANTEQRFEPSYPPESHSQSYSYSDEYSNAFTSPEAKLQLDNTLENTLKFESHSGSNLNAASEFNYGAFTSTEPDARNEETSFDSYQSAETGRGQSSLSVQLDPSNPMLSVFKKMDILMQEVQELRGRVEEQNFAIQNLQKSLRQSQEASHSGLEKQANGLEALKVDERLEPTFSLEQVEAVPSAISAFDFSSGSMTSPQAVLPQDEKLKEQEMYQQAYQFIQSKDYDSALMGFKSLVKTYPRGQHAPNANYWMGEIYLVQGELDLAAHAFDEVYQEFPQHPKASDALLKLGYVEYAKGQWIRSRNLLTQVKSQFPNSTSARLAETRLQRMHQEGRI